MSEKIKITIVISDEKENIENGNKKAKNVIVTHDTSMTLMSTLLKNGLIDGSFCGGRGDCGRCMVRFVEGAPLPSPLERSRLEAEELRQGFRLSCFAKPKDDCVIRIQLPNEPEISIVAEMMDLSEEIDLIGQQKKSSLKRKSNDMESDGAENILLSSDRNKAAVIETDVMNQSSDSHSSIVSSYMVAVDLGTTTIAMQLRDMDTGETVMTYCRMNPQRKYGSDVLSRIQASCEGYREELKWSVWEIIEQGVQKFTETVRKEFISCICVAGNTTMEHLLLGYDVSSLGRSPFIPVEIGLQKCVGPCDIPLYITPGISAFVGGDIVAGLYALEILPAPATRESIGTGLTEDTCLLIDLGTNGEMAITDGKEMLVTATAAGPAFEGGVGNAVIGTDMIAVIASLRKQGILDETGLLAEPYFTEGVNVHTSKGDFILGNQDVRALQMAKAAVRAGVEVLWGQLGKPGIEKVYLAGGFGYYLDVEAAFAIGLLPEHMRGSVQAVGNTSLEGAFRIGRDLCRQEMDKRLLEKGISSIKSINLAEQEEFEGLYLRYMNLCGN